MKTLIVPTDFSQAAYYAACYACVLSRQLGIENIVLYHSYQVVIAAGEGVLYAGDDKSLHDEAEAALRQLADSLKDQVPAGSSLNFRTDTKPLEDINDLVFEENAQMIVMGTTGKGKLEEIVEGSHALQVCEVSSVPVVLVPVEIQMHPVSNIVFACDLAEVKDTLPRREINRILDAFHVPLTVVYVGEEGEPVLSEAATASSSEPYAWLGSHHPSYHHLEDEDTAMAVLEFTEKMDSPIILVVSKKHGFPQGLFHRSVTKQLAFHSTVPLLVLREKKSPD